MIAAYDGFAPTLSFLAKIDDKIQTIRKWSFGVIDLSFASSMGKFERFLFE